MFADFMNTFTAALGSQDNFNLGSFIRAHQVTIEKYADVYSSKSKLDTFISIYLRNGTQRILDGDNEAAQLYATLASYFEEFFANMQTSSYPNATKIVELCEC